jgi:hypothetical protein
MDKIGSMLGGGGRNKTEQSTSGGQKDYLDKGE